MNLTAQEAREAISAGRKIQAKTFHDAPWADLTITDVALFDQWNALAPIARPAQFRLAPDQPDATVTEEKAAPFLTDAMVKEVLESFPKIDPPKERTIYMSGLNDRERAALTLRVPSSGTDWLDAMIREANRREFAAAALQGLLSKLPVIDQTGQFGIKVDDKHGYNSDVAHSCVELADALLAELRKEKP